MKLSRLVVLLIVAFSSNVSALGITISTVPIGNPGNSADMRYPISAPNGVGAVAYRYRIGKAEVTNAQYTEFLNAVASTDSYGLYNTSMGIDIAGGIVRSGVGGSFTYAVKPAALSGAYSYENKPVVFVGSGDAMRFANWLHNGQPSGAQDISTTEDGAYTMNGATTNNSLVHVTRNLAARWWLPNDDEWYKAAYHKNDDVTGNYWDYPTGSNSVPNNYVPASDTGNSANFNNNSYTTGNSDYHMTDAGAYTLSVSPYGTLDQGGNVLEMNETLFAGAFRRTRGGSSHSEFSLLSASVWNLMPDQDHGHHDIGFRLASIPEPTTMCLGVLVVVTPLFLRRGRS